MVYEVRIQYEEEAPTRAIAQSIVRHASQRALEGSELSSHIGELTSGGYVVSLTHIVRTPTEETARHITQNARLFFGIDGATDFETSANVVPYAQESALGGYEDAKPRATSSHVNGPTGGLPRPARPRIRN